MARPTNEEKLKALAGLEGDDVTMTDIVDALEEKLAGVGDRRVGIDLEALKAIFGLSDTVTPETWMHELRTRFDTVFKNANFILRFDGDTVILRPKNRTVRMHIYKRDIDPEGDGIRFHIEHVADRGLINKATGEMQSQVQVEISPSALACGGIIHDPKLTAHFDGDAESAEVKR